MHLTSHYIASHRITSHHITLHRITSHYIAFTSHYIALHRITLSASNAIWHLDQWSINRIYIALHRNYSPDWPSTQTSYTQVGYDQKGKSACIALHRITSHHITSHYIALHRITSHYIALTSHYIALHTLRDCVSNCIMRRLSDDEWRSHSPDGALHALVTSIHRDYNVITSHDITCTWHYMRRTTCRHYIYFNVHYGADLWEDMRGSDLHWIPAIKWALVDWLELHYEVQPIALHLQAV